MRLLSTILWAALALVCLATDVSAHEYNVCPPVTCQQERQWSYVYMLTDIKEAKDLKDLTEEQTVELQQGLKELSYYKDGEVDGIVGPKTYKAWREWKDNNYLGNPKTIGPASVRKFLSLVDEQDRQRTELDDPNKQEIIDHVIKTANDMGLTKTEQHAYILATIEHETNGTFEPVREAYWLSEQWRRDNLRYYPYYGRGYVQLTWRENYKKYEAITSEPLVDEPDRVMEPGTAVFILVHGFRYGTFTGHGLREFINDDKVDYYRARQCINKMDKANKIAQLARQWEDRL